MLALLARQFDQIPENPARTASARRLWDASIILPEAHRADVLTHLDIAWFPSPERAEKLDGLIESAAPLYQTGRVPEYDELYRTHGQFGENPEHTDEASSLRTPLWSAKAQTYMLPSEQRGQVRARIRELEGGVTHTVERLFPRRTDQFSDTNSDSRAYAIELMNRGFFEHEAGYLAGVSDLSLLRGVAYSTRPLTRRLKENVETLSEFVRTLESGHKHR